MKKITLLAMLFALLTFPMGYSQSLKGSAKIGQAQKTAFNNPAGSATQNLDNNQSRAPQTITQNNSQAIVLGESISCGSNDNQWYRSFDLTNDFSITEDFRVTNAEFGQQESVGAVVTINIYSLSGSFPADFSTSAVLQGTASYTTSAAEDMTVISVPVDATIPAGELLVYEMTVEAGPFFYPGANNAGQTGPCWFASTGCAFPITDISTIGGFEDTMLVMNIVGSELFPPVIVCPADIMASTDPSECGAIVNFADAIALDNEDGQIPTTQTMGPASGSMFPTGDTIVEFTAEDSDGNVVTCQFTVTVTDMEAPEALCQGLTLELDSTSGSVSIAPSDIDNGSTDNCGIVDYSLDKDTFTCADTGENTVTLTVTDDEGNSSMCTATVIIEDNTAPEITCIGEPGVFNILEEFEAASIPAGWTTVINAGVHDWTFGSEDMPTGDDFPSNAAIFDDDEAGIGEVNNASLISPVYDISGAVTADVSFDYAFQEVSSGETFLVEVWDGSAWQEILLVDADSPLTSTGAIDMSPYLNNDFQVRFTYDDAGTWGWGAGMDNFALNYELATSPPFEVELNANGIATISAEDLIQTVNEACGYNTTFGGGAPVTETITDAPGLTIDATTPVVSSTISITDDLPISDLDVILNIPHEWVGDLIIQLESPNGTVVTIMDQPGVPASSFGCGSDNIEATLDDEAANPVEDECGPTDMAIFGTFSPNNPLSAFDGESTMGDWTITVTDTFPAGDDGMLSEWGLTYSSLPNATMDLNCSNLGENEIEVFVTDDSGNSSSCTATVNVSDVTAPILVCNTETTVELGEDGTATIDPMALLATADSTYHAMVIGGDNGSLAEGLTDFTVEVTEAVTVSFDWGYTTDDTLAGFDSFGYTLNGTYNQLTDDAELNQSGNTSVALEIGDTFGFRVVTDDNFGGGSTSTITNFMPGFTGQFEPANWNLQLTNSDGDAFFVEIPGGPLSFDACGIDVLAVDVPEVSCADIGTPITVTVFASDASGNTASCTSIVNVVDTLAPEVTCPADQTVDPGTGNLFYEVPDYFANGEASALDNCTDPVTITSQDPAPGELIGDGVYTVTLTAEDEYGNVGTCTFELTVESELGIDENSLNNSISMYPNPADNQVTISNKSDVALQDAVIYDINGKLISKNDLRNMQGKKVIDVSALATGVYVVQITSETSSVSKRLIIK